MWAQHIAAEEEEAQEEDGSVSFYKSGGKSLHRYK
jgi:putative heme degradation protein